jgi:hypothetical protein
MFFHSGFLESAALQKSCIVDETIDLAAEGEVKRS